MTNQILETLCLPTIMSRHPKIWAITLTRPSHPWRNYLLKEYVRCEWTSLTNWKNHMIIATLRKTPSPDDVNRDAINFMTSQQKHNWGNKIEIIIWNWTRYVDREYRRCGIAIDLLRTTCAVPPWPVTLDVIFTPLSFENIDKGWRRLDPIYQRMNNKVKAKSKWANE